MSCSGSPLDLACERDWRGRYRVVCLACGWATAYAVSALEAWSAAEHHARDVTSLR